MKALFKKFSFLLMVSVLLIVNPLTSMANESWSMQYANPKLSNFNPTTLSEHLFLKHEIALTTLGNPTKMLVEGDTLYSIGSSGMKLYSVSLDTKQIMWEFTPPAGNDIRQIAIVNDNIAVQTYSNLYYVKDIGTDKIVLWEQNVGGNYISFDDTSIFSANQTTVSSIKIADGTKSWTYTIPTHEQFTRTILTSENNVHLFTYNRIEGANKIYGINKADGQVLWTTNVPVSPHTPVLQGNKMIIPSQKEIYAYDANKGLYLWKKALESGSVFFPQYENVISGNDTTIFGRTDKHKLVAYSADNGVNLFNTDFGEYQIGSGLYSRGPLLLTANEAILENSGKLKFFNTSNGQPTRIISLPNVFLIPILVTDRYLLAYGGENLYVYAPEVDEQYVDPDGDIPLEDPPAPIPAESEMFYVVQAGDTLWKISTIFGTTVEKLIKRNQLDPNHYLWVGQNLIVPKQQKTHTVGSGDTLWKIAKHYGVSISQLVEANNLDSNNYLVIGQKLLIPEPVITYTVQSGETLWKIAQQYNTTIQAISEKNKIDPAKHLWVGQLLVIPN